MTSDLIESNYAGGAVALLDALLRYAADRKASDVHIEPKLDRCNVRMRVDGALIAEKPIASDLAAEVVSRVKVLARMDIAERRVPQDGQMSIEHGGGRLHLRVSTFPTSYGEKVVLRLLLGQSLIAFDQLGIASDVAQQIRALARMPQGFIVTAGPTGAGKTSTLYSFLQLVDAARVNVVTLEDPIEVDIPSASQAQTNPKAGFTFATGLRAILRQDPDVILVGEVRDAETAGIALQASLTGHLVLSTLHTADTVETIVRLVDLGAEPWIVGNALSAVVAQRLVRLTCTKCRAEAKLEADLWDGEEILLAAGSSIVRPKGCDACHGTGYRGRTGVFEALVIDDDLRDMIKAKASAHEYRALLAKRNIPSLRRVGFQLAQTGRTTVDEVLRVTS